MTDLLRLVGIARRFPTSTGQLEVLRGVDLTLNAGELVALIGPSGSGKSTLLHIAGLLERPDEGMVTIEGRVTGALSDRERTRLRRERIGFVYQFHHLLPEFSALENVLLPQRLAGVPSSAARRRAVDLLELVGLGARASHRPARLSGGEQQRVAIARALANAPGLLLADEPTGNLDHATADQVFALLVGLARAHGLGALIATHNLDLARRMDRALIMQDGRVVLWTGTP